MAKDLGLAVDEELDFDFSEEKNKKSSIAKVLYKTESF